MLGRAGALEEVPQRLTEDQLLRTIWQAGKEARNPEISPAVWHAPLIVSFHASQCR